MTTMTTNTTSTTIATDVAPANLEKILEEKQKAASHRLWISKLAITMANHLIREGKMELAVGLLQRAEMHDLSKFGAEAKALAQLTGDQMVAIGSFHSPEAQELLKVHWSVNDHHPEWWGIYGLSLADMSESAIVEMVVDWASRSAELGTSLRGFVEGSHKKRFAFTAEQWNYIDQLVDVLDDYIEERRIAGEFPTRD